MACTIENRPELISPGYWGVDIKDNFRFVADDLLYRDVKISPRSRLFAVARLQYCLSRVLQHGYAETQLLSQGAFSPTEQELPDGSVVVIEQESLDQLIAPNTDNSEALTGAQMRAIMGSEGIPIQEPFVNYWISSQQVPDPTVFGRDRAYFDDNLVYTRELRWGVSLTGTNGVRALAIANFDGIKYAQDPPLETEVSDYSHRMPVRVGISGVEADFYTDSDKDCISRAIHRVRQIKVVEYNKDVAAVPQDLSARRNWLRSTQG